MGKKNKLNAGKHLVKLVIIFPIIISLLSNLMGSFGHQLKKAIRSFFSLLILSIIAALLLFTIWLCIMGLAYFYLLTFMLSQLSVVFILLIANILLLMIIAMLARKHKNNLALPEVRYYLRELYHCAKDIF